MPARKQLWGSETSKAVANFPISGEPIPVDVVRWLARIKGAAAAVNGELGLLPKAKATRIERAARDVADGRHDDQFPIDVFQTGSGTSSNMNANEVIAKLAGAGIHANDDVNMGQSSNDVFPSAVHLAALEVAERELLPALAQLERSLARKARSFKDIVKAGRTHLMDAVPVTLGQEFGGYAQAVEIGIERLRAVLPRVGELPLGGTAVGTGINAPKRFAPGVITLLAEKLDLPLTEARDHFEAQASRDALVECSGVLRTIALSLYKCANDIRWMGSGPRTGLREIFIPDLQPGSSIMPGKVNPVLPEAVCQVVSQVVGNDAAVAFGGSAGNFELNVMLPVIARNLLESIRLLASVSRAFAEKCVDGITANVEQCKAYAESSPSIGTSLNPYIGYEKAAEVIKESTKTGKLIRDLVLERGWMTDAELDKALDVLALTKGGTTK